MPYATRLQIEARLPSVEVADTAFDATVAEALLWGDAQVHTGLAGAGYTLPFSPAPPSISQVAADFCAVFVLRSQSESEPSQVAAKELYAEALSTMKSLVRNGIPDLPKPEPVEELPPAIGLAYHTQMGQRPQIDSNPLSPYYERPTLSGKPGGSWPW